MTMFLRLTLFCTFLMLLGCHHTTSVTYPNPEQLSAFSSVQIDGPYDVFFVEDATGYHIKAKGDQSVMAHSTFYVEENTLIVQLDPAYSQPVSPVIVTVYAPSLTNLKVIHANNINLEKLSIPNFQLSANQGNITVLNEFGDKATYTLTGNARFRGNCINTDKLIINASQQADVQLQCITTNELTINGHGAAHLDVTGQARNLNLTLDNQATFTSHDLTVGKFNIHSTQQAQTTLNKANIGLLSLTANDRTQTTLQGAIATLSARLNNYAELFINHARIQRIQIHSDNSSAVEITGLKVKHSSVSLDGDSYLRLTGYADRLDASLMHMAKLDSICLKTSNLFVRTRDRAEARVRNYHGLSAVASEESTIYYYQDPKMVAEYLRTSGSVIRMPGIVTPRC